MRPIALHYDDLKDETNVLLIVCPFHARAYKDHDGKMRTIVQTSLGTSYRVKETIDEIQELTLAALTEY